MEVKPRFITAMSADRRLQQPPQREQALHFEMSRNHELVEQRQTLVEMDHLVPKSAFQVSVSTRVTRKPTPAVLRLALTPPSATPRK